MDILILAERAMDPNKTAESLRDLRKSFRSTEESKSQRGKILLGEITNMILGRDPTCFEARVTRLRSEIRKKFLL